VTTCPGLPYISVSLISVNRKVTAHSHHSISAAIKPVSAPITDGSWTSKFAFEFNASARGIKSLASREPADESYFTIILDIYTNASKPVSLFFFFFQMKYVGFEVRSRGKAFKGHYVFSEITSITGSARLGRTLNTWNRCAYGGNRYHRPRLADLFDHARIRRNAL